MVASSHEIHENIHENTKNKKKWLDETHVVPSPAPTRNFRKSTKFTKRGTGAGVLFSSPLHVTGGEAFEYIRRCFSPPFPANRIGFAQAGFFGCTSVLCMGFFLMTVSPQGICLGRKHSVWSQIRDLLS